MVFIYIKIENKLSGLVRDEWLPMDNLRIINWRNHDLKIVSTSFFLPIGKNDEAVTLSIIIYRILHSNLSWGDTNGRIGGGLSINEPILRGLMIMGANNNKAAACCGVKREEVSCVRFFINAYILVLPGA